MANLEPSETRATSERAGRYLLSHVLLALVLESVQYVPDVYTKANHEGEEETEKPGVRIGKEGDGDAVSDPSPPHGDPCTKDDSDQLVDRDHALPLHEDRQSCSYYSYT